MEPPRRADPSTRPLCCADNDRTARLGRRRGSVARPAAIGWRRRRLAGSIDRGGATRGRPDRSSSSCCVSPFQYLPICHPHGLCRSEKGIGCSKNKVQNFLAARVGDAAFEFLTSKFFQKRVSDEYKEDAAAAHGDDKRLTSAAAACSKRRARIAAQVTEAASSA